MDKVLSFIAGARKALIVLVPAAYIVFGTDAPVVTDIVAVLTALGVYVIPNAK